MTPSINTLRLQRLELIQWRVRALDRIKRRVAGQMPGFPLSAGDAAIYEGLIEERCKRAGLLVLPADKELLSDVSDTSGLPSVLSGTHECVKSINNPSLNQRVGNRAGLTPLFPNVHEGSYPTKPTEGLTYPTEPTQGEI
jgi:hypothetical protein